MQRQPHSHTNRGLDVSPHPSSPSQRSCDDGDGERGASAVTQSHIQQQKPQRKEEEEKKERCRFRDAARLLLREQSFQRCSSHAAPFGHLSESIGHFLLRAGDIWILMAFCCTSSYFTRSGWLRSGRLDCGESANPPQNPVGGFMGVLKMRLASKFRASHSRRNKCWFPLQAKKGELDVTRLR